MDRIGDTCIVRTLSTCHLLIHSIFLLVVFSESVFAQTLDIVPFPKGIYLTLDDLLSINPSRAIEFTKVQGYNTKTYIIKDANKKRIKKPFAISDGVDLYINSKQSKKLIKGSGKGMQGAMGNTYNKILVGNRSFLYFEDYFATVGSAFMGGLSGVYTTYLCGVIFETSKRKVLESRRQEILEEPEFDGLTAAFDDAEHHNLEESLVQMARG